MSLYIGVNPLDRRIRMVCTTCNIDRICLTYNEAKRDAKTHKQAIHEQKTVA